MGYLLTDRFLVQPPGRILLSADAAGHTLKLHYGHDPANPDDTIMLNEITRDGNFSIAEGGVKFAIGGNVLWSGENVRRDGRRRLRSRARNTNVEISYNVHAANAVDLFRAQTRLHRYATEAQQWEEQRKGAPVWLEYRWVDGLKDVEPPEWGQMSHFYRVYSLDFAYPDSLHSGAILGGNITEATLKIECEPYARGTNQRLCNATGNRRDLPLTDELSATWTIAGWRRHADEDFTIFEYYIDASNHVRLWHDYSEAKIKLEIEDSGATTTTAYDHSLSAGDNCHYGVINTDGVNCKVYLNGSLIITGGDLSGADGTLYFGYSYSASDTAATSTHDFWRVWASNLTVTQLAQFYTIELEAKADGRVVMPLPYFETKGGDGVLDNEVHTSISVPKSNFGIAYNVPGTAEALAEYRIEPPTSSPSRVYWLGVAGYDDTFGIATMDGTTYLDIDDTDTTSGSGTDTAVFSATVTDADTIRGRWQVLAEFKSAGADVFVKPFVQFGSSDRIYGAQTLVEANANYLFRNFEDLIIDWPQDTSPSKVTIGLLATEAEAVAATLGLDFIQLMPYPNIRAEAQQSSLTLATGDTLYIRDNYAYVLDASDSDSQLQRFDTTGPAANLQPGKYNYVVLMMGEDGVAFGQTQTATVVVWITPRYTLPGGLV